jgi:hypothetical protein
MEGVSVSWNLEEMRPRYSKLTYLRSETVGQLIQDHK